MKRLKKSKERRISGVCGGISEYLDPELDPLIVRLGYIALTLFNPLMILFYIVLAIAMPAHDEI